MERMMKQAGKQPVVIGIGEVLWDLLPGGKQLGGAPANFAYHAKVLGAEAYVVSAVGDDPLAEESSISLIAWVWIAVSFTLITATPPERSPWNWTTRASRVT